MWLRAERQTAGRGRQGRAWESPTGNVYASTVVQVRPADPPAPSLALVAAVALEAAIAAGGCDHVQIKWPNDLLVDGAKISGILLERTGEWVVIGFGVNLVHAPEVPGRATAALAPHMRPTDAATFTRLLADTLDEWLSVWRAAGLAPVVARWLSRAHPGGTPLAARLPSGGEERGVFGGLTADGSMILRLADGGSRVIHAGDVFLV